MTVNNVDMVWARKTKHKTDKNVPIKQKMPNTIDGQSTSTICLIALYQFGPLQVHSCTTVLKPAQAGPVFLSKEIDKSWAQL